jgi:hypothetical protein
MKLMDCQDQVKRVCNTEQSCAILVVVVLAVGNGCVSCVEVVSCSVSAPKTFGSAA